MDRPVPGGDLGCYGQTGTHSVGCSEKGQGAVMGGFDNSQMSGIARGFSRRASPHAGAYENPLRTISCFLLVNTSVTHSCGLSLFRRRLLLFRLLSFSSARRGLSAFWYASSHRRSFMRPHSARCTWTIGWIGADADETALQRRCACDLGQKIFEFAEEIFLVFKKRLHLDIYL